MKNISNTLLIDYNTDINEFQSIFDFLENNDEKWDKNERVWTSTLFIILNRYIKGIIGWECHS